jgi:hypothetical protein
MCKQVTFELDHLRGRKEEKGDYRWMGGWIYHGVFTGYYLFAASILEMKKLKQANITFRVLHRQLQTLLCICCPMHKLPLKEKEALFTWKKVRLIIATVKSFF